MRNFSEQDWGLSAERHQKSLYARDPDGLEFEIVWLVPAAHLTPALKAMDPRPQPLDIDAEIARYGAHTAGGIGVSVTA